MNRLQARLPEITHLTCPPPLRLRSPRLFLSSCQGGKGEGVVHREKAPLPPDLYTGGEIVSYNQLHEEMEMNRIRIATLFLPLFFLATASWLPAAAPAHYYNDPKYINPDPNYTPGDYPMADTNQARALYAEQKRELAKRLDDEAYIATLGTGEITYTAIKNESATVLGYFRNYFGVARMGKKGVESVDLLIDVNSMDTAIPGRNNRILTLFFESMKPQFGTAAIHLSHFESAGKREGRHLVRASGEIRLNGVTRPISATLAYKRTGKTWSVQTASPIALQISDFGFGDRIYELMKACNHKSIGNRVEVKVDLRLR